MTAPFFKLGFVGGATNSAVGYAHFTAAHMDKKWEIQAGAFSRHADINQQTAQEYGVSPERVYKTLTELLQKEKNSLDAVAILTPTDQHHQMVIECLNAGMPVICEKALTLTASKAKEIQDTSRDTSGFLAVIYNYSGYPMVRELRKKIQDGILGDIIHFQAEMPQEGYIRTIGTDRHKPTPQDWRLRDGTIPTLHLDLAVHLHELIYYLIRQKPIEVIADQASKGWFDVIDYTSCLAHYTGNIQGQLWFSKCALGHRNGLRLRIYGTKAAAEWYQMNPEEVLISYQDGKKEVCDRASANTEVATLKRYDRFKSGHPAGFNEALANLYYDIHSALKRYRETGVQLSEEVFDAALAREGLLLFEAMERSCKSQKWETINA